MTKQTWSVKDSLYSKKDFALFRIKIDLFISKARKEGQLCFSDNKPTRVSYVFYILTVFSRFLRLHHRHCPRITISVSLLRALLFLAQDQSGQSQAHLAHLGYRSEQRIRLILHTGTASDIIRDVTKRGTVSKVWDLFNFNTRNNKLQNLKNFKVAQFWLHSVKLQAPEKKKKRKTPLTVKKDLFILFFFWMNNDNTNDWKKFGISFLFALELSI